MRILELEVSFSFASISKGKRLLKRDILSCRTATNVTEATQLIENGFEYITQIDGIRIFRKRK